MNLACALALLHLEQAEAGAAKAAYRKMCLATHPDKGGSADAFQVIQDAYAVVVNATDSGGLDQPLPKSECGDAKGTPPGLTVFHDLLAQCFHDGRWWRVADARCKSCGRKAFKKPFYTQEGMEQAAWCHSEWCKEC